MKREPPRDEDSAANDVVQPPSSKPRKMMIAYARASARGGNKAERLTKKQKGETRESCEGPWAETPSASVASEQPLTAAAMGELNTLTVGFGQ